MKKLILGSILALCFASQAKAGYVRGYYRSNGTYVAPHYRTAPDGIKYNNYSYDGNYNPYTGNYGTLR